MNTLSNFFLGLFLIILLIQPICAEVLNPSSNQSGYFANSSSHLSTNFTFNETSPKGIQIPVVSSNQSLSSSQAGANSNSQNPFSLATASSNSARTSSYEKSPVTFIADPITKREYFTDQDSVSVLAPMSVTVNETSVLTTYEVLNLTSPSTYTAEPPTSLIITQNVTSLSTSLGNHGTSNTGNSTITNSTSGRQYASGEVIVRYNYNKIKNTTVMTVYSTRTNAKMGAFVKKDFSSKNFPGMQLVKIPDNLSVTDAIAEYQKNPDVLYAQPNYVYHTAAKTPNDPSYSFQWALHNTGQQVNGVTGTPDADIDAPEAWDVSSGSNTVVVAVIDTGVLYTHSDLATNIWTNPGEIPGNDVDDDHNGYIDDTYGWNFVTNTSDPLDDNGHGTHVSGTIGAVGNNGIGVTGVNWHIKIMSLKAFDASGDGYTSDVVSAILYANANGASVISNSWSGSEFDQALNDVIDTSPAVVVCAAGNFDPVYSPEKNNDVVPQYPASFTSANIISVAATDQNDNLAPFSHYGPESVDLGAPGTNIMSTLNVNGMYGYKHGTSQATPHVSGVAALVKSVNQSLTAVQIKNIILSTVDGKSSLSGMVSTGGRLNAYRAVMATPLAPPVADFTGTPRTGTVPLTVTFTDFSANIPTGWVWDFGDGNVTNATLKNPVHTYLTAGLYNVTLYATNYAGSNVTTKYNFINVMNTTDKIGVYQNGIWYLDYNGNGTWDGPMNDKEYIFDGPGNVSVVGDWNGDGITEIGVTNSVNWSLDYNGNGKWDGPVVDRAPYFGIAGFTPKVGDWNGDGKEKVGVYNSGIWYLDANGDGVYNTGIDKAYSFGGPGNVSIVGDWNGDGITEVGVTNSINWSLDYNGNGKWDGPVVDRAPYFGIIGYIPVVGDWNRDGITEVGVTNNVYWYLDYNGNGTWDGMVVDRAPYFGIVGYTPVVGDWNGDGKAEVGVTNDVYWYLDSNGNGVWDGHVIDKAPYFGVNGFTPVVGKWQ